MVQKLQFFSLLCTKKKFKNDQDVCWLEEDYMEMKKIVRDQSKNYFHLTPKIGSLWGGRVGLNHTLIVKLYCFKNIIYIFKYTQFVVVPQ